MLSRTRSHQIIMASDAVDRPCVAWKLIKREGSSNTFLQTNKVFCTLPAPSVTMGTALKRKVWERLTRSQRGESISGWPTCFSETYWPDRTPQGRCWWTRSDTIHVPGETVSLWQHTPRTQTQWDGGRCSRTKLLLCSEVCPSSWHKKPPDARYPTQNTAQRAA